MTREINYPPYDGSNIYTEVYKNIPFPKWVWGEFICIRIEHNVKNLNLFTGLSYEHTHKSFFPYGVIPTRIHTFEIYAGIYL